jgi:magnesium-transporting ATPase (P-type)
VHWNTNNNSDGENGFFYFFLQACGKWTIFLLLVSAGFAFAIDITGHGLKDGWYDGVAILVAVFLLVAFPSVGNFHHERKRVKKMLKNIRKLEVNVVRSGNPRRIAISDVVEGDVVHLKKDDRIPADGLFVKGENLVVDEVFNSKIDRDQNPFLVSGSKVVDGHCTMLVTPDAVDNNTAMSSHYPDEKTLLQARIAEPNGYNEMFALCVTLLIALVLLIRLLCGKHNSSKDSPELKGNVSVGMMMKIFEKISLKSQGKIWILTSALSAMVIGIQHGMPVVITVSLNCWNKKVQRYGAEPRNLSACGTMGHVTDICIDATGWLMCNQVEVNKFFLGEKDIGNGAVDSETSQVVVEALHQGLEEITSVVKNLISAGVGVKLISEDDLSAVTPIAFEIEIFDPAGSNHVALKAEEIREMISSGRMEKLDLVTVVGSCLPEDKLWIIQQLQKEGHIVAFFGGLTTRDTLPLKEADVGITARRRSTELARESSDITVKYFGSLSHILKFGRCSYHNIQKFIQLQLTACISGFTIALVTTMVSGASPITGIEMFWVNWVMYLMGSPVLLMELKTQKPAKGSLLTKAMWGNIAAQVIYQVSVLLIFQFKGFGTIDDVQKTMIFNMFCLCQIFNQFNAMDIVKKDVLKVVVRSYWFLVTLAAVMTMQVLVIEYSGVVTSFVRLNAVQWASCCIVAALPLALKSLGEFFNTWYSLVSRSADHSNDGFSNRMPRPYVSHFGVPFFMFLFPALPGLFAIVNQYENLPEACR